MGPTAPDSWIAACDDLDTLFQLEGFLGVDILPDAYALEKEVLGGIRTGYRGKVVQVDDGDITWWGALDDWDTSLDRTILNLAKSKLTGDELDREWYSRACADTECYGGTMGVSLSKDAPGVALTMMAEWVAARWSRYDCRLARDLRKSLKERRWDLRLEYTRSVVAKFLREHR